MKWSWIKIKVYLNLERGKQEIYVTSSYTFIMYFDQNSWGI